jgi:uncharacterized protein (TIGR02145 family)
MKKVIVVVVLLVFCILCSKNSNPLTNSSLSAPSLYSPLNNATNQNFSIKLIWTTVSGAATYDVQVSTKSTFDTITVQDSSLTDAFKQINMSSYNTTYYWRVRSRNTAGPSAWSAVWKFTTIIGTPDLVLPENNATNQSLTPTLIWSKMGNSAGTTYRVQVSTNSVFSSFVENDSWLTDTFKITSQLLMNTTYYWRVNATNIDTTSGWSYPNSFTTTHSAPTQSPTLITPVNGATNIAYISKLTWSSITDAALYQLQISSTSTFANTIYNDSMLTDCVYSFLANSSSTTYYWRVRAKNISGITGWSAIFNFTTAAYSTVTDADGNVYHTITIGTQTWTVENLKTTKYSDGTAIPLVTDKTAWSNLTTPGYCYYNNTTNADSINKFCALYNWYAVNTGKLAPLGWHVPTAAEWAILEEYMIAHGYNYDGTTTGNKIAKSMAAQTSWSTSTNTGAIGNNLSTNNSSGFSAFPGGSRDNSGSFGDIGYNGIWWSSASNGAIRTLSSYGGNLSSNGYGSSFKSRGFSVRLLRDN